MPLNGHPISIPMNQVSNIDRAHLIDWIAKIHNAIEGLKQETLHICVNIIDTVLL